LLECSANASELRGADASRSGKFSPEVGLIRKASIVRYGRHRLLGVCNSARGALQTRTTQ
jgi:hypothetical protein